MARNLNFSRPKNTKKTLLQLLAYLGRHKWYMLVTGVLVAVSASANIMGTYLLKPVINNYIIPGDIPGLVRMLLFILLTAGIAGNIAVVFQHFLIFRRSKLKGLYGQVEQVAADEIQTDGIISRAGAGLWDDRSSLMRDPVLRKIDRFQQDA